MPFRDPDRPLDAAAVDAKSHRLLDPLIGQDAATKLIGVAGCGLDDAAGCRALAYAFAEVFSDRRAKEVGA